MDSIPKTFLIIPLLMSLIVACATEESRREKMRLWEEEFHRQQTIEFEQAKERNTIASYGDFLKRNYFRGQTTLTYDACSRLLELCFDYTQAGTYISADNPLQGFINIVPSYDTCPYKKFTANAKSKIDRVLCGAVNKTIKVIHLTWEHRDPNTGRLIREFLPRYLGDAGFLVVFDDPYRRADLNMAITTGASTLVERYSHPDIADRGVYVYYGYSTRSDLTLNLIKGSKEVIEGTKKVIYSPYPWREFSTSCSDVYENPLYKPSLHPFINVGPSDLSRGYIKGYSDTEVISSLKGCIIRSINEVFYRLLYALKPREEDRPLTPRDKLSK